MHLMILSNQLTNHLIIFSLRVLADHPAPKIKADGAQKRREASEIRNAWLRQKYCGKS